MASNAKPAKKLRELLQEQQEPFILEIYLLERKCLKKSSCSNCAFINTSNANYSSKILKKSLSFNNNYSNPSKSQERSNKTRSTSTLAHYSKVLQAIRKKLFSIKNEHLRGKNHKSDAQFCVVVDEKIRNKEEEEVAEADRCSSASSSSTTVYHSCSDDGGDQDEKDQAKINPLQAPNFLTKSYNYIPREGAASVVKKIQWSLCMEDTKQLSPVSVLEQVACYGISPRHHDHQDFSRDLENPTKFVGKYPGRVTEDSILSASLWRLLVRQGTEKLHSSGIPGVQETENKSYSLHQLMKSNRVLLQTKQLLLDCVKDAIAAQEKKRNKRKELLGSEDIGKLICQITKAWGIELSIRQVVDLNALRFDECSDLELHKRDIVVEIADAIVKELKHEIVLDMLNIIH